MKKITLLLFLLVSTLTANAQFEQGKRYVGVSSTGIGMQYSDSERLRFGLDAHAGYFAADCLMLHANVGYEHTRVTDDVRIGLGARYYFDQCGVFLGAGAEYNHFTKSNNDVMIPINVGYCFFLSRNLTVEPSAFYKMSLHDFSENSCVGFSIGLGYYF